MMVECGWTSDFIWGSSPPLLGGVSRAPPTPGRASSSLLEDQNQPPDS